MSVTEYLKAIERALSRGDATEHTYRSYLQAFLESRQAIDATNEPKREKCGAPDYVVSRRKDRLTIGYVEAKDVGVDLTQVEKTEQLARYRQHLPNLLLTDYLEFRWFVQRDGKSKEEDRARLGSVGPGGKIVFDADEQPKALQLIDSFLVEKPLRITSAHDLAVRLAHFTHLIRDIITEAYASGAASQQLRDWRAAFAATLLPELDVQTDKTKEKEAVAEFADMFAQTLAYGLFSARAARPGGRFNREQARKLIPRTNPFLRDFFEQITGTKLDDEPFAGFVDDIIQTLAYADIDDILRGFGKRGRRTDPVVHFYETFLRAYDPKLRKLRGVYYTPEPVVNYIVESIDALLKLRFGLKQGLADRSTITTNRKVGDKEIGEESHRVLILDPATGTATFLYRVLDFIRDQFERKKNLGAWGDYVHEHLLPRLFGFELLMAPYAVAHFKLGLALAAWDKEPLFRPQWSYEPRQGERINIFLANTLEDADARVTELIGPPRALSEEARDAQNIKKHKPVLVVLGNPPYSNFGRQNRGEWILGLLDDYKRGLNEKKININDDFIKFIRWAQWRIEQTGQGVVGYITNNIYLDGPTHRRMREFLLDTFDEIYIVNLHGSSKKQEKTPEGGKDENVFDITVGVAIAIFVKLPAAKAVKGNAVVRYADLWGTRANKYKWLDGHSISNTQWKKLSPAAPGFYLVPRTVVEKTDYENYWSVPRIFPVGISGIKTHRDELLIAFDRDTLIKRFKTIAETEDLQLLKNKFGIEDTAYWTLAHAKQHLKTKAISNSVHDYCYRPFDERFILFEPKIIERGDARWSVMRHMLEPNLALVCTRQTNPGLFSEVFATTRLLDKRCLASYTGEARLYPLYLYPNGELPDDDLFVREQAEQERRRPNFSAEFIKEFCDRLEVKFVRDGLGKPSKREIGPELVFNYIYAVFHSPAYRDRYAEFLRSDFPRVPLTTDYTLFKELAGFGGHLLDLHTRENGNGNGTSFPVKGSNDVEDVRYQAPSTGKDRHPGRVWINDDQYFEGVAPAVWEFPIGGYLPAQRWLKDRMGRSLSFGDMTTYPRIVFALGETARLMNEIDKSIKAHGGWPKAFA